MTLLTNGRRVFTNFVRFFATRRGFLYVPGNDENKIQQALDTSVDCIAFDCEETVPEDKKKQARENIKSMIEKLRTDETNKTNIVVRLNPLNSPNIDEDVDTILTAEHQPDGIIIPKLSYAWQLEKTLNKLDDIFRFRNRSVDLILSIESTEIMGNLVPFSGALYRRPPSKFIMNTILLRGDKFASTLDCSGDKLTRELFIWRQRLIIVAFTLGVQAIDMACSNSKDIEQLIKECEEGAAMGYAGKQIMDSEQAVQVQNYFNSPAKKLEFSEGMIKTLRSYRKKNKLNLQHDTDLLKLSF